MKVPKELKHLVKEMIKANKCKALHVGINRFSDTYHSYESQDPIMLVTTEHFIRWSKIVEQKN